MSVRARSVCVYYVMLFSAPSDAANWARRVGHLGHLTADAAVASDGLFVSFNVVDTHTDKGGEMICLYVP